MRSAQRETVASSFERRAAGSGEARLLEVVQGRQVPDFYIVDSALTVHLRRGDGDGPKGVRQLPLDIAHAVKRIIDSVESSDMSVAAVRRDLAVRVQRLYGGPEPRYAIFLEPYRGRDFVQAAVRRYALTSREGAVLDLVLRGEAHEPDRFAPGHRRDDGAPARQEPGRKSRRHQAQRHRRDRPRPRRRLIPSKRYLFVGMAAARCAM